MRSASCTLAYVSKPRVWDDDAQSWKITGRPEELKQTQQYPIGFGRGMVSFVFLCK